MHSIRALPLWCHDLRLGLSVIARNLGNLCCPLVLPKSIEGWFLTSVQHRSVKRSGSLLRNGTITDYLLVLAETQLTWLLPGAMPRRIGSLPLPAG